jgi:hypothetical protein
VETYRSALVVKRKNLDWNLRIIFVFDGFVQPHSCIPYVHMGSIMQKYNTLKLRILDCAFSEVEE